MTKPTNADRIKELTTQLFELVDPNTNLKPLQDRVLVKDIQENASSVIHTLDNNKTDKGIVVCSGPGRTNKYGVRVPTCVSPGDIVLFNKHSGERKAIHGERYRLIKAGDLMCKVSPS